MTSSKAREGGSILILTLWCVTLLSLLAYSLLLRGSLGSRQVQWQRLEHKATTLVDSLAMQALHAYENDDSAETDGFVDSWMAPFEESSLAILPGFSGAVLTDDAFSLRITPEDESGKLNINTVTLETITYVLEYLGVDDPATVAEAIIDWRDEDDTGLAENDYYTNLDPAYFAGNRPFARVEELLFVRGIQGGGEHWFFGEDQNRNGMLDPEEDDGPLSWPPDNGDGLLQPGLVDIFTVFGEGAVNASTASELVLRASLADSPLDPDELDRVIDAILKTRRGADQRDGYFQGAVDDHPFEDWAALVDVVAQALRDASGERSRGVMAGFDVVSVAARFQVSVTFTEQGFERGGTLLLSRIEDEFKVEEWRDW